MHPPQLNPGQPLGRDGQLLSLDNDQLLAPGTVVRYIDELIATSSRRTPSSSFARSAQYNDSLRAHLVAGVLVAGVRHPWLIGISNRRSTRYGEITSSNQRTWERCHASGKRQRRRCSTTPLVLEDDPMQPPKVIVAGDRA